MRDLRSNFCLLHVTGGVLELAPVHRVQVLPGFVLLEDATERRDGFLVRRRQCVEDHAMRADRVVESRQPLLVHLTESAVELDLVQRVLGCHRALLEHASELRPLLERAVDAIEVGEGILFARLHREHVAIGFFCLGDVGQLFFEDSREALADSGLRRSVDTLDRQHVGVSIGERLPAAVEHAGQTLDLFTRTLVERGLFDGTHVDVEGQHRIEQALFCVLRDAVVHGHALGRIGGVSELGFANADQLLPLTHRLVERLQNLADFQLLRAGFEQRLQRAQRVLVLGGGADHLAVGSNGLIQIAQP
jgi:hypothetical protein